MSDKRIYELTAASTVSADDLLALDNQNFTKTKKVTANKFLENCTAKSTVANLITSGSTNTTGSTITAGTYFYLNGDLCVAKTDIASGASYTQGTNYDLVSIGDQLTALNGALGQQSEASGISGNTAFAKIKTVSDSHVYISYDEGMTDATLKLIPSGQLQLVIVANGSVKRLSLGTPS